MTTHRPTPPSEIRPPEWERVNREHDEQAVARTRDATPAELLARGQRLSVVAARWRRAAWDSQHANPAA